jgi:anti-anti-sigma factor
VGDHGGLGDAAPERLDAAQAAVGECLAGRLNARTAPAARAALHATVRDGDGELLVRVADLEIWDTAGMGVLVGTHALARRRGRRLVLVDVPPRQLRLLRATRVAARSPSACSPSHSRCQG